MILRFMLLVLPVVELTGTARSPSVPAKSTTAHCSRANCARDAACLSCIFPNECRMGETVTVRCSTLPECTTQESMRREVKCGYCWQLPPSEYDCAPLWNCSTTSRQLVQTTCHVHPSVICKGNRQFSKNVKCNWSSGLSWTKTMILSVTLGGFGADRFYLGLWKSAIGKLFSFGGLGIWTVVDIVLIATGYIRPADGSMYM